MPARAVGRARFRVSTVALDVGPEELHEALETQLHLDDVDLDEASLRPDMHAGADTQEALIELPDEEADLLRGPMREAKVFFDSAGSTMTLCFVELGRGGAGAGHANSGGGRAPQPPAAKEAAVAGGAAATSGGGLAALDDALRQHRLQEFHEEQESAAAKHGRQEAFKEGDARPGRARGAAPASRDPDPQEEPSRSRAAGPRRQHSPAPARGEQAPASAAASAPASARDEARLQRMAELRRQIVDDLGEPSPRPPSFDASGHAQRPPNFDGPWDGSPKTAWQRPQNPQGDGDDYSADLAHCSRLGEIKPFRACTNSCSLQ